MVLIIGGRSAGKRSFARSLGYRDEEMSRDVSSAAPVIFDLEETVRSAPDRADELLERLSEKEVVICSEVGSGIIPLSAEDRRFRETCGRLLVKLAQRADTVVRIVAGIPTAIKGELPCGRF